MIYRNRKVIYVNDFCMCLIYLALIGVMFFIVGRVLPKEKFSFERFPFCSLPIEDGGKIYQRIGVHKWKDSFPDMSRIFPLLMPSKKLPRAVTAGQIELMIQETCIAEWIHGLLGIFGFGCVFIWKSIGGWIMSVLYLLGNLPYMIIQRYNRPKFVSLLRIMRKREGRVRNVEYHDRKAESKWNRKMTF